MSDHCDITLERKLGSSADDTARVPSQVRRIELITLTGRRRRWSSDDKARIVMESFGPDANVSDVARRNRLSPQQVFAWRRQAERDTIAAERDQIGWRNERLEASIAEIRRVHFGRKSERITDDQLALALDDPETSLAQAQAEREKDEPALTTERAKKLSTSRNPGLEQLSHEAVVIEPEGGTVCPCCGGERHVIGEDTSKRPDKVPAKVRVIVTRRPKYACRTCEKTGAAKPRPDTCGPLPAMTGHGAAAMLPPLRTHLPPDVVASTPCGCSMASTASCKWTDRRLQKTRCADANRRTAGLDHRCPDQARQSMAGVAHRRPDARGLRQDRLSRLPSGAAGPVSVLPSSINIFNDPGEPPPTRHRSASAA